MKQRASVTETQTVVDPILKWSREIVAETCLLSRRVFIKEVPFIFDRQFQGGASALKVFGSRWTVCIPLVAMIQDIPAMIRPWLDSYPWFSQPTRLWLDSFESESSQIWLTTHESSTTLPTCTLFCEWPQWSWTRRKELSSLSDTLPVWSGRVRRSVGQPAQAQGRTPVVVSDVSEHESTHPGLTLVFQPPPLPSVEVMHISHWLTWVAWSRKPVKSEVRGSPRPIFSALCICKQGCGVNMPLSAWTSWKHLLKLIFSERSSAGGPVLRWQPSGTGHDISKPRYILLYMSSSNRRSLQRVSFGILIRLGFQLSRLQRCLLKYTVVLKWVCTSGLPWVVGSAGQPLHLQPRGRPALVLCDDESCGWPCSSGGVNYRVI